MLGCVDMVWLWPQLMATLAPFVLTTPDCRARAHARRCVCYTKTQAFKTCLFGDRPGMGPLLAFTWN